MTQSLTKTAENALLSAIDNICDSQDSDVEALHKSAIAQAREYSFGPHMIRLMCQGWNNGAVTHHRETHDGVLQKHASFPILDPDKVITGVYGEQPKAEDTEVSEDYSLPPRKPATESKSAEFTLRAERSAPDPNSLFSFGRKLAQAKRLRAEIDAANVDVDNCERELLHKIASVAEYFKRDRTRDWLFGEVSYAVAMKYGKSAEAVMQTVADYNGYTVKTANSLPRKAVNWEATPFKDVREAIKAAESVLAARQHALTLAVDNRLKIAQLLGTLVEPRQEAPATVLKQAQAEPVTAEQISARLKQAFLSGGISDLSVLGGALYGATGHKQPDRDAVVNSMLNDLTDPEHDEKLDEIRVRTMLQEFMTRDPILKSYDPQEVMRAYNNLSTLAPRSSKQPVVANSVLRRWATQGGVEPFEAKELGDIEKGLKSTQSLASAPEKEASPVFAERRNSVLK